MGVVAGPAAAGGAGTAARSAVLESPGKVTEEVRHRWRPRYYLRPRFFFYYSTPYYFRPYPYYYRPYRYYYYRRW
jgi:hypothetical protein